MRDLLDRAGEGTDLRALNQVLVEKIRNGEFDALEPQRALLRHLQAATAAKLAIDNPRYK